MGEAMPQLTVIVTPGSGTKSTIVHIDAVDVSNGGKFTLVSGVHIVHWWFAGNSGSKLDVSISPLSDGSTLRISDSISPPNLLEAGDKTFDV